MSINFSDFDQDQEHQTITFSGHQFRAERESGRDLPGRSGSPGGLRKVKRSRPATVGTKKEQFGLGNLWTIKV